MSRKIQIKCQFFQVNKYFEGNDNKKEELYNLGHWISRVNELDLLQLKKEFNGIKGRLENCNNVESRFFTFNFVKMLDYSSTYVVKQGEAAKHVDISVENDEYIGNNTVAIYDSEKSIFVVMGTRAGFSAYSITNYINSFFEKPVCYLKPIRNKTDLFKRTNKYGKIKIKIKSVEDYVPTPGVVYEDALEVAKNMGAESYEFEFNVGRKRDKYLDADTVRTIMSDALHNLGAVSIAQVKMTDEKGTNVYELFDNVQKYTLTLEANDNGEVPYSIIASAMVEKYKDTSFYT